MSAPLLGQSPESHGQTRLGVSLLLVFASIWISAAVVFHRGWEEIAREQEAGPRSAPGAKHAEVHIPRHDLPASLYRGLQLFHFHDLHWPDEAAPEKPHHAVDAVRFLAGFFALGLPIVVLGWIFQGRVVKLWHRRPWHTRFVVVAGSSEEATRLAEDIAVNGRHVVQLVKSGAPMIARSRRILVIAGDPDDPSLWRKTVCVERAEAVVVMQGTDDENIRLSQILEKAVPRKRGGAPIICHVHLSHLHLQRGLVRLLPASSDTAPIVRRYFNRFEIMARLLVRKHPLPPELVEEEAKPDHYIVVGFGPFGQNITLKLVRMAQQIVRSRTPGGSEFKVCHPRVTVIDRRGRGAAEAFLRSNPGFEQTCEFEVINADCESQEFLELQFLKRAATPERRIVIFCLEDDALVVSSILMMLDVCHQPDTRVDRVFFRSTRERGVGHLLEAQSGKLDHDIPIVSFGRDSEVFTADAVLNLSLDLMAECIHSAYLAVAKIGGTPQNPAPAANRTWMALTEVERNGNREPADHMWSKLRTLGFALETAPLGASHASVEVTPEDEALSAKIETHLEELAASEHYRWMAWRIINGWTCAPQRDDARKQHPDLVAYEELSEHTREKDRIIVRLIPELLRIGRLSARILPGKAAMDK